MSYKCASLHCIASPILSCFFKQVSRATISSSHKCSLRFPDNTCGQLCKSNTSTLSLNSSWCTVAIDWTMYWCLCPFLGWLHNRGEGKPCVAIQVESYEYLVSRWYPEHLPLHIHTYTHTHRTPSCPLTSSIHPWTPHKCSGQSQINTDIDTHGDRQSDSG